MTRHSAPPPNERVIEQASDESLRVEVKFFFEGFARFIVVFFLLLAVLFLFTGEGVMALFSLLVAALQIYSILASGSIEMNENSIAHISAISVHRIGWDEVTKVEMDLLGWSLVLIGQNKRLKIFGPEFWRGMDKEEMQKLFWAQAETRGIEVKQTLKAQWRRNKNTKVRLESQ
jgi:hypothetical protein